MEQDHHPSPQQGPREVVPEPVPERPAAEPEPTSQPDVIMSKLPRKRPQHVTDRRRREQARDQAAGSRTPAPLRSQKTQPAAAARTGVATPPRKPAARAAATRSKAGASAATAAKPRASAGARARRPKQAKPAGRRTSAPRARPAAQTPPPARREQGNGAPSLPRLAVDGAMEAAKLPLRVGGRLTLRALDAIARGLRS